MNHISGGMEEGPISSASRKDFLIRQLKQLQGKAEEVAANIRAVDATFQDMGFRFPIDLDLSKPKIKPNNGIRLPQKFRGGQELLSFRGQHKARELFRFIDRDRDKLMNFEDFRALKSFSSPSSVVQESQFRNWETWRLYMHDCDLSTTSDASPVDSQKEFTGKAQNADGLTENQFLRYCCRVEATQPLTPQLKFLNLGFLPQTQQHWLKCKQLCQELFDFRESRRPPKLASSPINDGIEDTVGNDDRFTFEDVSFVVNNLNFGLTKPEIAELMLHRARKHRLHEEMLRAVFSRRMLSQQDFPFSLDAETKRLTLHLSQEQRVRGDVTVEEYSTIDRRQLLPWLLTCPHIEITSSRRILHYKQFNPTSSSKSDVDAPYAPIDNAQADHGMVQRLYRALLIGKSHLIRAVRLIESTSRVMFHFAGHMNDRLIFRDFPPFFKLSNSNTNSSNQKALLEVSTWKLGVSVGDEEDRDGGLSGTLKITKIDNAGPTFKAMKVPADAGACLAIDFLFAPETTIFEQERCAELMKRFLAYHFEKELRSNRLCNGIKCMATRNESDESRVLRVAVSYKRIVSLDGWLEHMLIPYKIVPDLLSVLVMDFRSNIDLPDLLSANRVSSLSDSFAASVDLTVGIRRNLVVSLLERAWMAMSAGITKDQATGHRPSSAGDKAAAVSVKEEEERQVRLWRWQQLLPHFPWLVKQTRRAVRCVKCMKTMILRLKFTSLGEMLHKLNVSLFGSSSNDHHRQNEYQYDGFHLLPSIRQVFRAGWLKERYDSFVQQYAFEFNRMHCSLKDYLEERKRIDDRRRKEELMNCDAIDVNQHIGGSPQPQTAQREKEITLERLKRLGVDTGGNSGKDIFDVEPDQPDAFNDTIWEESTKQDIQNLILLEHLRKHLIGFHSADLILGKMRATANIQGLDLFELLPELPSMLQVQGETTLKSTFAAGGETI